jgi:hypothetical protein
MGTITGVTGTVAHGGTKGFKPHGLKEQTDRRPSKPPTNGRKPNLTKGHVAYHGK